MGENATDCLIKEATWQLEKCECVTYSIANELTACVKNQQDRIRRLEAALAVSTEKAKSVAYKVHYIEKEQYDRDCEGMHYMPSWGSLPKRERRIRVQSIKKAMRDTFRLEESK